MTLVIGSRGSQLALWQANHIASRLAGRGIETRIEIIKTTGDHLQTASLVQAGGKGLFTKEIEEALLNGSIDVAVHSLKDLPTENPPGLAIAAVPEREDPRDALVGSRLDALREGARVGTSSERRGAQLRALRAGLIVEPIRGNVDTRLRKQKQGEFDAIVLAGAGLRRLGLEREIAQILEPHEMCPAPGQGALAVQTRAEGEAREILSGLNHFPTHQAVRCERTLLAILGGGCQLPVGAFAEWRSGLLHLMAVVVSPDGSRLLRAASSGMEAAAVAETVARDLESQGAAKILAECV